MNKLKLSALLGALLLITFCALRPTLDNQFTNWDDNRYVTYNPVIRELSWKNVGHIFTSFHSGETHTSAHAEGLYKPLVILTYAVEYHFVGLEPRLYHITNLILHLANVLLVFWLITLLGGGTMTAFLTALLFGIHPLHVESVAWVTERKDVLYTLFLLLSGIEYLIYLRGSRKRHLAGSWACFTLSLMAKPMGITLPAILFLFDFLKKRRFSLKLLWEKIPFAVSALFFLWLFYVGRQMATYEAPPMITFPGNLLFAAYSLVFYVKKLLFPVALCNLYRFPSEGPGGSWPPEQIFALLAVLNAGAAVVLSLRWTRKILFGVLFFVISLLPILNLIPGADYSPSDRYTYVAAIGLFYLFGEGVRLMDQQARSWSWGRPLLITAVSAALLSCAVLSYQRSKVWYDGVTLWDDALKKGIKEYISYNSRGLGYFERGLYIKSLPDFEASVPLARGPLEKAKALNNRGIAYGALRQYDEAIADFRHAIAIVPDFTDAKKNLAVALRKKAAVPKPVWQMEGVLKPSGGLLPMTPLEAESRENLPDFTFNP